jgi:hypothetical protein
LNWQPDALSLDSNDSISTLSASGRVVGTSPFDPPSFAVVGMASNAPSTRAANGKE